MQKNKNVTKMVLFFAVLTLTISFSSISGAQAIIGFQTFKGTVTDSSTGSPIANVKVTVYRLSMTYDTDYTDSSGKYTLIVGPLLSKIYVTLKYEKSGYQTKYIGKTARPGYTTTVNTALIASTPDYDLATDWGRHPTDSRIKNLAEDILIDKYGSSWTSKTSYEKAYALWEYVHDNWNHVTGGTIQPDTSVYNTLSGPCYSSANLLTGLFRSIGLRSRIIMAYMEDAADEHAFTEVYTGAASHNGWTTACADPGAGGWFDWTDFTSTIYWKWNHAITALDVEYMHYVYEVTGSSQSGTGTSVWSDIESIYHGYTAGYDENWVTWDDYKAAIPYS